MPIAEWSFKISDGWPDDPNDDVAGDAWASVGSWEPTNALPSRDPIASQTNVALLPVDGDQDGTSRAAL